jgi:hypothetical protein
MNTFRAQPPASVRKFNEAAVAMTAGSPLRIDVAKAMKAAFEQGLGFIGDPVSDWRRARHLLQEIQAWLFRASVRVANDAGKPYEDHESV